MIDKNKHRRRYVRAFLGFLIIGILIVTSQLFIPKDISKYTSKKFTPFGGGSLGFELVKKEYSPADQKLKLAYRITNQDPSTTKAQDFNGRLTALTTDDNIEILSNTRFTSGVVGLNLKGYFKTKQYVVNNNYLEIIVDDIPESERVVKVRIDPEIINKNLDGIDNKDHKITDMYIQTSSFKKVSNVISSSTAAKNDSIMTQIDKLNSIIKQGQSEIKAAKDNTKNKKSLISKIKLNIETDTDEQATYHESSIDKYKTSIKNNSDKIKQIKSSISDIRDQIRELKLKIK